MLEGSRGTVCLQHHGSDGREVREVLGTELQSTKHCCFLAFIMAGVAVCSVHGCSCLCVP